MASITRARVIAARMPAMQSRSYSFCTGPSSIIKAEPPFSSLLRLLIDPNSPLVWSGSSMGPNGQNASSSTGPSTAVNEIGRSES